MAFSVIPADSIDRDSYLFEALGVRGAPEALLRNMLALGQTFAYVGYAPSAVQGLKKAAALLKGEGHTFDILKAGKTYREVTITRQATDKSKGFSFTRQYLNVDMLSIEYVKPEAPADTTDTTTTDQ